MKSAIFFVKFLFLFFICAFTSPQVCTAMDGVVDRLMGVGYGQTEDEAKSAAMDDLASIIKSRVYSKYNLSTYSVDGQAARESTRFVKIISDVPIINPQVVYSKEKRLIKAIVSISNSVAYIKHLNDLTGTINSMLRSAQDTDDLSLRFNILEKLLPFYDEFDRYAVVLIVMGVEGYDKPSISGSQVLEWYISMEETPPDLDVAADILTRNFKDRRNIFVATPLAVGGEVTDFGIFFGKLLSSKVHMSIEERADYRFKCVYAETGDVLLTSCALFSGGSSIASRAVKIPIRLLAKLNYKPKNMGKLAVAGNSVGQLKSSVRISPENNPNIIRDGDYFTILIRLNKPAYVYVAAFPAGNSIGVSGIEAIGGEKGFLRRIEDENTGMWLSLGRFHAGYPLGAATIYLFAVADKPKNVEELIPDYLRKKLYSAEKTKEEIASDLISIFNKLEGEKTLSVTNIPVVGK